MTDQYPPQNPYGQQSGGQQPGAQQNPYGQNPYGQQPGHTPQYGAPAPTGQGGEPPLWAPWYGISFPKAFTRFWKKYVRFDGRASRSEFWWWALWAVIANVVFNILDNIVAGATGTTSTMSTAANPMTSSPIADLPSSLWSLAILLPSIALLMRRLHDANLSGWWWLLSFIPILGWIALLVMVLQASRPEGQRFDRPEKG